MPGHAVAALLAYPKLSAGTPPPRSIQSDWGVFPYAFGIDEPVFDFLGVALNEVMDIFPSRFIAVGGDEVVAEAWTGAPKVQARMKALGLADAGAAHAWFIGRIGAILAARGRRLIGWDEILEGGGLPAGDAVASWRGAAPARTAVASGHDVVLAVSPTLYLDHRQSDLPGEPAGRGDVVSLADVYAFDPQLPPPTAPAPGPAVAPGKVLGLEGALWTEHISTFPHLQAMAFPRAAAVAELGWSPAAGHDWADFLARLPAEFARFETLGMAEDESALKVKADVEPALAVRRRASQELRGCTDKVTLNLEGAAAASGARPVYLVDIMNPCWIWPGADLSGVSALSVGVDRLPFNFQIGAARDRIDLRPPATADGELEVHLDGCASPTAAVLPLAPAVARPGPAILTAPLAPQSGRHDLCFVFTAARIDPMWVLGFVQLEPSATAPGPA
jgi:hexosaminidase